jgi:hypothetical protein
VLYVRSVLSAMLHIVEASLLSCCRGDYGTVGVVVVCGKIGVLVGVVV